MNIFLHHIVGHCRSTQKQSDGEDWSLGNKEQWEKIEAEIFSEELPKRKKSKGEMKGKAHPGYGDKGSHKVEETSFISRTFTPRAEASLTAGSTCRLVLYIFAELPSSHTKCRINMR